MNGMGDEPPCEIDDKEERLAVRASSGVPTSFEDQIDEYDDMLELRVWFGSHMAAPALRSTALI